MTKNDTRPSKLLWLDLEMTGLNPVEDLILEVAAKITDFGFKSINTYQATVNQPKDIVQNRMDKNVWWESFPGNRAHFIEHLSAGKALSDIEEDLLELIEIDFKGGLVILAGNSIYNDRSFIKQHMPKLNHKLHYRMLDVSAWKVLMQGRYNEFYEKPEVHRASDDIEASIAELQHYIEWFKRNL